MSDTREDETTRYDNDRHRHERRRPGFGARFRRQRRRTGLGPMFPGLLIMALGLVLLLDNLDLVDSDQILRFWPVILIAIGVKNLFEAQDRSGAVNGTLFAGLGGLLLLNSLDILSFNIFQLWPLFLVMIGFHMLTRALSGPPQPSEATNAFETSFAFLSGVERRNNSPDFNGGSATAFMGGVDLDLSEADIAGEVAVFSVFAMMGGIDIRIPEGWKLENKVTPFLGGVEDRTRGPADPKKLFVVEGTVIMGGVEIKN